MAMAEMATTTALTRGGDVLELGHVSTWSFKGALGGHLMHTKVATVRSTVSSDDVRQGYELS